MTKSIRVPLAQECSTCIIDSLQTIIPLLSDDKETQFKLYSAAFKRLAQGFEEREDPASLSIQLYQQLYIAANNMDPFQMLKKISNQAAKKASPFIKMKIEKLEGYEQFRAAIAASITGNVIDYNTAGHEPDLDELEKLFEEIIQVGFRIDDSKALWDRLGESSETLSFLADNAGETYFDIPLLQIMKDKGWKIYYIVKGQPMINDATEEDVRGTEIDQLADIRTTGAWAHGTPRKWVSEEFIKLISDSQIVISKGQANIETFPEIQEELEVETYYLLKGKCPHISRALGANKGDNIILRIQ